MENTLSRVKYLTIISIALFLYASVCLKVRANSASFFELPILQQEQEVTGIVTDSNGIPIPGVAVRIKDSSNGTITDSDGVYTISVASDATLIFNYLGFQEMEVAVDAKREINVRLDEDITALGEVEINAGYYHTTRRESTGNISRVTAEEIESQPVVSPIEALQGRMAGVEIIPGGHHPGMASTIRIRGRNSLRTDGNFPLYIIDGVPVASTPIESGGVKAHTGIDPLNNLNLSNIESIEVLKDADATAIYGSRGANGVVLITTKKASPGKIQLETQVYYGAATMPNRLDLLNTQQYLQIRRQALKNDGVEPTVSNAYDLVVFDQNRYTDWQEYFFGGTSTINNVNISSTGGNENTTFRLGGSYHNQGTIYPGDYDYEKITGNMNLNHTSINRKFSIDLSVNYGIDHTNSVGMTSLNRRVFELPPNAPAIFDENGNLNWKDWTDVGETNPWEGAHNESKTQSVNLLSNLNISYEILPDLKIVTSLGYSDFNSNENIKRPQRSYNPVYWETTKNRSSVRNGSRRSWIVEPQLTYDKSLGKSNFTALIGATFQESKYSYSYIQAEGYVSEALIGNLDAADNIFDASSSNTIYRYNAIFGRFGYNWDERYFLNLTGRRDGSSRFGPGNKIASFWALGGAWIFVENQSDSFLSFGKFRGSYGTTGNDQIGDYGYLDAYEATFGSGGLYPTQLANPDYSWEINKKLEAAVDLGFVQDRITLSASWFRNRSSNQLVGYALPATTGFTTIQANLPATVENTGFELEASTLNIKFSDFQWKTSFNLTIPKNKLVSYPDIENSSYANMYRVGHPLNISLLFQYDGIDPETGLYRVKDINDDGYYNYHDRNKIWNRDKEFYGGINNDLIYKNFSFHFFWEFTKQEGTFELFDAGRLGQQRDDTIEALGKDSHYQKASASRASQTAYLNMLNTTFPIVDASYLRLKTVSLSYSLPTSILKATGIDNGRIFLNGQNLLTLTSYKGMDPSMPHIGIQFAGLRSITGGLTLTL